MYPRDKRPIKPYAKNSSSVLLLSCTGSFSSVDCDYDGNTTLKMTPCEKENASNTLAYLICKTEHDPVP